MSTGFYFTSSDPPFNSLSRDHERARGARLCGNRARLSTPSLGITVWAASPFPPARPTAFQLPLSGSLVFCVFVFKRSVADGLAFNSLSRDHCRSSATDDGRRRRNTFQLPLSGSPIASFVAAPRAEGKYFQLPLSGSLHQPRDHQPSAARPRAFNSLSRDHEHLSVRRRIDGFEHAYFQLPLSGSRASAVSTVVNVEIVLSTPSLGITFLTGLAYSGSRNSGLSTPSLGITEILWWNSSCRVPEVFQLPLSGSRDHERCWSSSIRYSAESLSTPSLGIT